jgi:hypothetical protein
VTLSVLVTSRINHWDVQHEKFKGSHKRKFIFITTTYEYVGVASNSYQLVNWLTPSLKPTVFITAICRHFEEMH